MNLKVGLIQMTCHKNSIETNLQRTLDIIDEAVRFKIDILCFPEMSLTGYSDPLLNPSVQLSFDSPAVQKLVNYTQNLSLHVLIGMIERNVSGNPYITQLIIYHGKIKSYYRKITIIDEEELWFSPGNKIESIDLHGITAGLTVCADIRTEHIFSNYANHKVKLIFELAAPGLYGAQETRNWESGFSWWKRECIEHFCKYSKVFQFWIFVATQAGRTINEDFPGGGYVFSPNGELLYSTPNGDPCRVYLDVDLENNLVVELAMLK